MVKRVLMIAFHYPPIRGSSGVQRTLSFSRCLREHGWHPTVLTVGKSAFELRSDDQLADIPRDVEVHRATTLDAGRHLSIKGRSPGVLSLPDRWASWYWSGSWLGSRLIRKTRFDAIWSTYPIATAHRIAAKLARDSGIPWVADFRDMMVDEWFPDDPARRRWHERIENAAVRQASRVVVTTPGTRDLYRKRFGDQEAAKFACISNGYDEHILGEIESSKQHAAAPSGRLRVVHSGILYTLERDPKPLFEAIGRLRKAGSPVVEGLEIVFRGSRHGAAYRPVIEQLGIGDVVRFEPGIGYREAISEMFDADGLLLMQGASCNNQIPAKVYEYMRVGKPLLALTDGAGDTARLLESVDYGLVAALDDVAGIEKALADFVGQLRNKDARLPRPGVIRQYTRESASRKLVELLDAATQGNGRQTSSSVG